MAYLERVAELAVGTRGADLPPAAIAEAKTAFMDTIAVMVTGRRTRAGRAVAAAATELAGPGRSSVVGGPASTAPAAALVNATCAHAEDFDDATLQVLTGHISTVLVPATLAAGEQAGASGADVLAAYVVGYEIIMAVADLVNPYHYEHGFHPTSTVGVLGAAAATARLYGLSVAQTATALGIATSLASGIKANFGTGTKPLHCGRAAEGGITAAVLAASGLTANPSAMEARQGFRAVFGRPGDDTPLGDVRRPGAPWTVVDPGIGLRKAWPCCGAAHTSLESMLTLRERHGFTGADIAAIETQIHPRRMPHIDRPEPTTGDAARFSAQACLAFAAADGRVGVDTFETDQLRRPEIQALIRKVTVVPDPGAAGAPAVMDGTDFGATVTVRLTDGTELSEKTDFPLGTPQRPMPAAWLERKFDDCVRPAVPGDVYQPLFDVVSNLDTLASVGDLGAHLRLVRTESA